VGTGTARSPLSAIGTAGRWPDEEIRITVTTDNTVHARAPHTSSRGPAGPAPVPTPVPTPSPTPPGGAIGRLRGAVDVLYREAMKFGAIGALAYVVDVYVFNLLLSGWWPLTSAPLGHKAVTCKVISVSAATVVAWLGNRYWTFRHRRRATARSEFVLFVVMNIGGLLIAAGCLGVSHYLLGLTSKLADNVSANLVGLVLGTLFRFWAYRRFVFTELRETPPAPV